MLYKLTSGKEIPHYKPRGKMIYFAKVHLDEWLLQNYEPTVDEAARMANAIASHTANHPDALHFTEDIRTLELSPLVSHVKRMKKIYPDAKLIKCK